MRLTPLYEKLIVRRLESPDKTPGGIVIPDTGKKKPTKGEVVAIGDGRLLQDGTLVPLKVKVGDQIIFTEYGGIDIEIDQKKFTVLSENEILAILEPDNA